MPIAETLENIYTPWSQIGLTQQSLNTIVKDKSASSQVQAFRKGKWSEEEELFTKKLISAFMMDTLWYLLVQHYALSFRKIILVSIFMHRAGRCMQSLTL